MIRAFLLTLALTVPSLAQADQLRTESALRSESSKVQGMLNLNSATAEELERLPAIGPGKAKAIVDYRRTHPFHKVDEIVKVKGIGHKTFGRLRPYISIAGPNTLKEPVARQ